MDDERPKNNWWKNESENAAADIASHVGELRQLQLDRIQTDLLLEQIYESEGGRRNAAERALQILRSAGYQGASVNVSRSIVDTLTAKVSKANPAIKVTADGAQYSLKRKAEKLTKFIRGKSEEVEIQELDPVLVNDALVVGTGIVYVGHAHGEIVVERVPRRELFVDEYEARYGLPRNLHRVRKIDRDVLAGRYEKHKSEIKSAPVAPMREEDEQYGYAYVGGQNNLVELYQSWHLPSAPGAKDGVYVVSIENKVLYRGTWKMDRFPFSLLRWKTAKNDFWGRSGLKELAPLQLKLDELLDDALQAFYWGGQLKLFSTRGANVNRNTAFARGPTVVEYDGAKPTFESPNPVSAQLIQMIDWVVNRMYETFGVSQMSAAAKNPLGAGASGVALQEFYDQQTERYADFEKAFALWRRDIAELMIWNAKQIAESGEDDYEAKWSDRDVIQRISWKDVDMEKDTYVLKLEPSNFIPDTRAGKLAASQELMQAGVIPGEFVPELFQEPDVREANKVGLAPLRYIQYVMEKLGDVDVDENGNVVAQADFIPPNGYMDLELAIKHARAAWQHCAAEEAPEAVRDRYDRFMRLAHKEMTKIQAAAAPPPMPVAETGLPPGAAPEALPGEAMPGVEPL